MSVVMPDEAKAVQDSNMLVFHSVGDTGGIHGDDVEKAISNAMESQISAAKSGGGAPAFYYNLGDVVYYNGESNQYDNQFYEPYQYYSAPIFAIPGNHDGDTQVQRGDPIDTEPSLYGFMQNFCNMTSSYQSPYRPTMTQPYVYWTYELPFATIIGLYSNVDGTLDARGTSEQQTWFQDQYTKADPEKALIVAVHHPPYSLDVVHGGYPDIEVAIDRAMQATGRAPTAVFSGHVHSYQRFERDLDANKVPYIIAGAGGYANRAGLMHKVEKGSDGGPLHSGFQTTHKDLKLAWHNDEQPGFLRATLDANKKTLTSEYFLVPFAGAPLDTPEDTVTVPW